MRLAIKPSGESVKHGRRNTRSFHSSAEGYSLAHISRTQPLNAEISPRDDENPIDRARPPPVFAL